MLRAMTPEQEEAIFERWASGITVKAIATELGVPMRVLHFWIADSPDRKRLWEEARKIRAEVLAEESVQIIDDCDMHPDAINKATQRSKARQWLASVSDPSRFGKKLDVAITVNSIHLEAVEEINKADTERRLAAAKEKESRTVDADFEVISPPDAPASIEDLL